MKYYIGIDAGGSKTDCLMTDENLNIINSLKGEGFNLTRDGINRASDILADLIPQLIKKTASSEEISVIGIGAAGAGRNELKSSLENTLSSHLIGFSHSKIKVFTDAEAAYTASFPEGNGFIIISGTGSIIFGRNKNGEYFRAGGYGQLIDKGSGFSLGKKAFIHAASVLDKIHPADNFYSELFTVYNIKSKEDLIKYINNPDINISDAARIVIASADDKIPSALSIIEEETDELLKLISSIVNQTSNAAFKLSFNGSLISNNNCYSGLLREKISQKFKEITIITPKYPPAIGSILLSTSKD